MNPEQLRLAVTAWQSARSLHQAGRLREAEPLYRKALQAMPRNADLLVDYGHLAEALGDWRAAGNIWRVAEQAAPTRSFGDHLGLALLQQEQPAAALVALERHQQRQPDDVSSLINLGICYSRLDRDDAAEASLRRAVALRPGDARCQEALLTLLINRGDQPGAEAALAAALTALPDHAELRYMEMEHLLKSGRYADGFARFEARWGTRFANAAIRLPPVPRWRGEPFTGRLLVRAEQGIGDELLYSSLFNELRQRHPDVIIDCDARLLPLFTRSFPDLEFIARSAPEDDPRRRGYVRQCLMGDLPVLFRRTASDFPASPGWLQPDPVQREALRARYAASHPGQLRVGLSWRSSHPGNGTAKSLTLLQLLPLLQLPNVQFFSLQYGDTAQELADLSARTGIVIARDPAIDPTRDLDGLAAQMAAMDLVISTSNSTVHLAGALGLPVWILLHRDRGLPWYWGYDGATTPWYPATQLLRCARRGAWEPVIADATARLAGRIGR